MESAARYQATFGAAVRTLPGACGHRRGYDLSPFVIAPKLRDFGLARETNDADTCGGTRRILRPARSVCAVWTPDQVKELYGAAKSTAGSTTGIDDALPTVGMTKAVPGQCEQPARNAFRSGLSPWAATPGSPDCLHAVVGMPYADNDAVDISAASRVRR